MLSARCFFPRSRGAATGRHPRAAPTPFIIGSHAPSCLPAPAGTPGMSSRCTCTGHEKGRAAAAPPAPHVAPRQSSAGGPCPPFPVRGRQARRFQKAAARRQARARGEIDRSCSCPGRPGGATRPAAGRGSKPCVRASRETARAALSLQRCAASPSLPGRQGSSPDRDRIGGSLSGAAAVRAATPTRRGRVRVAAGFPQLDRIARPARGLGGVRAAAARWNIVPSVRRITVVRWGRAW